MSSHLNILWTSITTPNVDCDGRVSTRHLFCLLWICYKL